ncbi:MAG: hypothetical protein QXT64_00920 [Desulfurococcaceae archaeon]
MSVRFEKLKPGTKISELTEAYKRKVESSILPPDPARLVELVLRTLPMIEHMLPVPPILETIHDEVASKLVESLPRLPLTSEPPVIKWKEWVKEEL